MAEEALTARLDPDLAQTVGGQMRSSCICTSGSTFSQRALLKKQGLVRVLSVICRYQGRSGPYIEQPVVWSTLAQDG